MRRENDRDLRLRTTKDLSVMERESYTNDMFLGTFQSVLVSIRYGGECSIYLCS